MVRASLSLVTDLALDPAAYLCHYTRADVAFEHILPSQELRMSPYARMRDPFENRYPHLWVPGGIGGDERRSTWVNVLNHVGRSAGCMTPAPAAPRPLA